MVAPLDPSIPQDEREGAWWPRRAGSLRVGALAARESCPPTFRSFSCRCLCLKAPAFLH